MAEHKRPDGLYQGYFCMRCGHAGVNMYGMGLNHPSPCPNESNPELVKELIELNKD